MGSIKSSFCETADDHAMNGVFPWATFGAILFFLSLVVYCCHTSHAHRFESPFLSPPIGKYLTSATIFYQLIVYSNGMAALITTILTAGGYQWCMYDTMISYGSMENSDVVSGRSSHYFWFYLLYWVATLFIMLQIFWVIWNKVSNKAVHPVPMLQAAPVQVTTMTPDGVILGSVLQQAPPQPLPDDSPTMEAYRKKRGARAVIYNGVLCGLSLMFKPLYLLDYDGNSGQLCKCTDPGLRAFGYFYVYLPVAALFIGVAVCFGIYCSRTKCIPTGMISAAGIIFMWCIIRFYSGHDTPYGVLYVTVIYFIVLTAVHFYYVCSPSAGKQQVRELQMAVEMQEGGDGNSGNGGV